MGFKNECGCYWNGANWMWMCEKHRKEFLKELRAYHNILTNIQEEDKEAFLQQSLF